MGSDALTVVDAEPRVCAAVGLRIVDASIMPRLISGHTNMAITMIVEKATGLITGKLALAPELQTP